MTCITHGTHDGRSRWIGHYVGDAWHNGGGAGSGIRAGSRASTWRRDLPIATCMVGRQTWGNSSATPLQQLRVVLAPRATPFVTEIFLAAYAFFERALRVRGGWDDPLDSPIASAHAATPALARMRPALRRRASSPEQKKVEVLLMCELSRARRGQCGAHVG